MCHPADIKGDENKMGKPEIETNVANTEFLNNVSTLTDRDQSSVNGERSELLLIMIFDIYPIS